MGRYLRKYAPRDISHVVLKNYSFFNPMGAAIGFAAILIVLGIFLPEVLDALKELFLMLIDMAIMYINTL